MDQQQKYLSEHVEQWAIENGFKLVAICEVDVKFERLSDGYPMDVNKRLLTQMMRDDEMAKGSK